MSTIARQVLEAQLLALNTGRPGSVPEVTEEQIDDLPENVALAVSIGDHLQKVTRDSVTKPIVTRQHITAVDIWARGDATNSAAKKADPAIAWVTQALGGNKLGGLVSHAEEGEIQWDRERKLTRMAHVTVFVVSTFPTKVNDATAKS